MTFRRFSDPGWGESAEGSHWLQDECSADRSRSGFCALKAGADYIILDGRGGGTEVAPLLFS